ncbi:MAG: hypothetical protein V2A73_02420, partial [Pseudomonadota bacterium]
ISRQYATHTVVNMVLGMTFAVREYYRRHNQSWENLVESVAWTSADAARAANAIRFEPMVLPKPPGTEPPAASTPCLPIEDYDRWRPGGQPYRPNAAEEQCRSLPTQFTPAKWKGYGLNAQYNYQEYRIGNDDCFIESHDWCLRDSRWGAVAQVCPKGTSEKWPKFVKPSDVEGQILLSSDNVGGPDEFVHVESGYQFRYRKQLTEARGATVDVPPGALINGVSVFCTGPDIFNEWDVDARTGEKTPHVRCEMGALQKVGVVECTPEEREIKEVLDSFTLNANQTLRNATRVIPRQPIPRPIAVRPPLPSLSGVVPIDALAAYYGASAKSLATALASVRGVPVTLTDPSPYGIATISWQDQTRQTNTVTVTWNGNVVTRVTR